MTIAGWLGGWDGRVSATAHDQRKRTIQRDSAERATLRETNRREHLLHLALTRTYTVRTVQYVRYVGPTALLY